jgi:hypothetical protein
MVRCGWEAGTRTWQFTKLKRYFADEERESHQVPNPVDIKDMVRITRLGSSKNQCLVQEGTWQDFARFFVAVEADDLVAWMFVKFLKRCSTVIGRPA